MHDDQTPDEVLETSGPEPTGEPGTRRRRLALVVGGLAVAAVAGGAAWGAAVFLSGGGDRPSAALPADTMGYIALDLDPSLGDKVEALQMLRQFPGLREQSGMDSTGDLKETVVEGLLEDSPCADLSYDEQIAPWLGDRMAAAYVETDAEGPVPVVALQTTSTESVEAAVKAFGDCAELGSVGSAFVGDYVLVTTTQKAADEVAGRAEESSLEDSTRFTEQVEAAGGATFVTGYLKAEAYESFVESMAVSEGIPAEDVEKMTERSPWGEGEGVFTLGIADGAFQVEAVSSSEQTAEMTFAELGADDFGSLPSTTVAAAAMSVPDNLVSAMLDSVESQLGPAGGELTAEIQRSTGLSLPADLQRILGEEVAIALDESFVASMEDDSPLGATPSSPGIGVRLHTDPVDASITLGRLLGSTGMSSMVWTEKGDGVVALGSDQATAEALTQKGTLGDSPRVADALPGLGDAVAAAYVDMDAVMRMLAADDALPAEVEDNLEPLSAFGMTVTVEGETTHSLLRLTLDQD